MSGMRSRVIYITGGLGEEFFFCDMCNDFLTAPVWINGRNYCLGCVEKWVKLFNTYPNHGKACDIRPGCNIDWNCLFFTCEYKRYGCKEVLHRFEYETHAKSCSFNPIKSDQDYNVLNAKLKALTEENIGLKKEIQDLKSKEIDDKNMVHQISELNTKFDQLKGVLADIEAGLNVSN